MNVLSMSSKTDSNHHISALQRQPCLLKTNSPKNAWFEFVFNRHCCRWRAEMCRFKSVLEDSAFILNKEQRNTIKAFVDRKDVFAVLPTGFGKSLIYQLAPMKIGRAHV